MPGAAQPPQTVEEAEAHRDALVLEIQRVQAQLGDKQRTDGSGRRLSSRDYWAWRRDATNALNDMTSELRAVKAWLKTQGRGAPQVNESDALVHLRALFLLLERLKNEDVELHTTELDTIHNAGTFLKVSGVMT